MDEFFTIHVEQLKDGRRCKINFETDSAFLDVKEADVQFEAPVLLKGEAYLADSTLILHLDIITEAKVTCSICNEFLAIPVHLIGFYHSEDMGAIRGGVFSFRDLIREEILLDLPIKSECEGNCPSRKQFAKYFAQKESVDAELYQPFKDLNIGD